MAPLTLISWNVRGLNSKIKRSLVFNYLKTYQPDLCLLQETHLTGSRILGLKKPWVGHHYHATYSSYARGVSVLVRKTLPFELLDLRLDPEGKYVVLHAAIAGTPLVVVGVYIPPPASISLLNKISQIVATYPTDNLILAGDFNMVTCPSMDRMASADSRESSLAGWASTFGLTDVWRWKYPSRRSYTCQSATYRAMSRIDLIFVSNPILARVAEVSILPRGISDHAPLLLRFHVLPAPTDCLWRLSRYWISDDRVAPQVDSAVREYWEATPAQSCSAATWEVFKVHIKGVYQSAVASVRRDSTSALLQAEARAAVLERSYTAVRDEVTRRDLQGALREVMLLRVSAAKKRLLYQSQRIFEQGERNGKLLAWLSKEQSMTTCIARVRDAAGTLRSTPEDINSCFAAYYEELYSSRTQYAASDLQEFLDGVSLPRLAEEDRGHLDAPLTLEELQRAIGALQAGKTPGDDGFPAEFYKTHGEALAGRLLGVLEESRRTSSIPPSMTRAVIVVIPKPGKDLELCSSYRPISLLNVDAKILAKTLALRLNRVILSLVHGDQTGFMPGKGTDINLRRLYTVLSVAGSGRVPGVVASLDAEKAFDSVEWEYLWSVLHKFGLGPNFISWVKLLYTKPMARIRTNGVLSPPFPLHRGTRQGCPLSPTLFALALEPLAVLLRDSAVVRGLSFPPLTEKVSLYADDTLLYLNDAHHSLAAALKVIDGFGLFSGFRVNWDKSVLFSLTADVPPGGLPGPLRWVTGFKYLGIMVRRELANYLDDNVYPILQRFIQRCSVWRTLPLTPVGRVNLIKMTFLPKFLYVFRHTPVPIPKAFFSRLDRAISSFIWAGSVPRIARVKLQLPLSEGGLALPNFLKYYWAAVLVTVRWWFVQDRSNPAVNLEAAILGSHSELSTLVYKGPKSNSHVTTPMKTTVMIWRQVSRYLNDPGALSPHTPIWGNPFLSHLGSVPDPKAWVRFAILTLSHIMPEGRLLSFVEMKRKFQFPPWMFFRHLQLAHAVRAQFPTQVSLVIHSVERLLRANNIDKTLSSIYLRLTSQGTSQTLVLFQKWHRDIPNLSEEDWVEGLQQFVPLMISARDRFVQLKFLHRAYYTPQRLAGMYPATSDICPKCRQSVGDFFHMTWTCPVLQSYWQQVVSAVGDLCGINLTLDPLILLLGMTDTILTDKYTKLFVFYAAYYARKVILSKWKGSDPPQLSAWKSMINATLPLYKLTYMGRNCPRKFDRVWSPWCHDELNTL